MMKKDKISLPGPVWTYTGQIRVHFNRKEEYPLLASITAVDHKWEMLAQHVVIMGVELMSACDMDAKPGLQPVWWLFGYAKVTVNSEGVAVITKEEV